MNNRTRSRKTKWRIKKTPFNQSLVVSIVVIIILLLSNAIFQPNEVKGVSGTKEVASTKVTQEAIATLDKEVKEEVIAQEVIPYVAEENVSRSIFIDRKDILFYNDIALSKYLQQYTYELVALCGDVDYNTVLSMLYCESKFDANAVGYNTNGSIDEGIAQINSNSRSHFAETSGLYGDFNPYNPEHGIKAMVYKLQMLADVWKAQGITDKDTLELYTIQSYHRGVNGFKNDMAINGTAHSPYSDKIFKAKEELIRTGNITL